MTEVLQKVEEPMDCTESPKVSIETFDSEPGFYQLVIKPMLSPGHENELVMWFKEFGLIPQDLTCKVVTKENTICDSPMTWTRHNAVKDLYQWRCKHGDCKGRRRIRENSIFLDVKCTLQDATRILLGWCKDYSVETLSKILNLKPHVIKSLYKHCVKNAERYIRKNVKEWYMGGEDKYVLVDLYPDGCAKALNGMPENQNNNEEPILCIAEVNTFPTQYWFHRLDRHVLHKDTFKVKQEALAMVQTMVRPGTTIIADANARVCSAQELKTLKGYPLVVSTDSLMRHDTDTETLVDILEQIWGPAICVCEEAQTMHKNEIQGFLFSKLWKTEFKDRAFQTLLSQLSYSYFLHGGALVEQQKSAVL